MLHVCSLSKLNETVAATGAKSVVTLINAEMDVPTPEGVPPDRHLFLAFNDIVEQVAALTPQQTRIMKLICAGKPNKQIAYELSLAEATVKAHITALLRRLGVQNRTQAAVLVESVSLESAIEADMGETDDPPDA